jgi:DNA adenine methylase
VPTITSWLSRHAPRLSVLIDPFTGGGSVPLGVLNDGLVDQLVLGELDPDVSAVWDCVFGFSSAELCLRINNFSVSRESVLEELSKPAETVVDRAFQTLLKNRTFRGGILAPGASLMKNGENGKGVSSRWYPETLVKRLEILQALSAQVEFVEGDAFSLIDRFIHRTDVAFFIDPPYTAGNGKRAGLRLYRHNELDHDALFLLLTKARGPVLMTYDDCPEAVQLANSYGFAFERIPMKNTHHVKKFELLITNSAESYM